MQIRKTLLPAAIIVGFSIVAMAVADIGPFSTVRHIAVVQNSVAPTLLGAVPETVQFQLLHDDSASAIYDETPKVVSLIKPYARVTLPDPAQKLLKYQVRINGVVGDREFPFTSPRGQNRIDLTDFENQSEINLRAVVFDPAAGNAITAQSVEYKLRVDTEGPILTQASLSNESNEDVVLQFREDDLGSTAEFDSGHVPATPATYYRIHKIENGQYGPAKTLVSAVKVGRQITVTLSEDLTQGTYEVTVGPGVTDRYDNPAGQLNSSEKQAQSLTFVVAGESETGPAIEFPQFTRRPPSDRNSFNPGNHVETRVVRLYNERDAHRVAQVINRNLQSYNKDGVDDKRTIVGVARTSANNAQLRVDRQERQGIAAANRRDQARKTLAAAQEELTGRQNSLVRARQIIRQIDAIAPPQQLVGIEISGATLNDATLNSATITGSRITGVTGGNPTTVYGTGNAGEGQVERGKTTGGTVSSGSLTSGVPDEFGPISQGTITRATITDGQITAGTITAGSESSNTTTGAAVNAAQISNARLTNATVVNIRFQMNPSLQRQIDSLRDELTQLTGNPNSTLTNLGSLTTAINKLQNEVTNAQAELTSAQEAVDSAKQRIADAEFESRLASRNKFEAEVAAATEDPDSYAPARLDSVDPVFQVSVSVIGEGLIQLRGPIQGINEIRKMVSQIDAPVGQVKAGIFTVQVNGEHGDKMEEVAAEIEGHIDLSRTLTNRSLQLIRRSIQEEAACIVDQVNSQYQGHRQVDRDRRYVYEFFGRDFIDELLAMDSEFLRSENKLLSLHSMDTVSLSQALFILALAKNDVRQSILSRFNSQAQSVLTEEEFQFRRAQNLWPKGLKKSQWVSRMFGHSSLDRYRKGTKDKLTNAQMQFVCNKSREWNRFANFNGFFTTQVYSPDTMNPLQREFIRLAQIFKSKLIAEMEINQRVIERGLIQDGMGNVERLRNRAIAQQEQSQEVLRQASQTRATQLAKTQSTVQNVIYYGFGELESTTEALDTAKTRYGFDQLVSVIGPKQFPDRVPPAGLPLFVSPKSGPPLVLRFRRKNNDDQLIGEESNHELQPRLSVELLGASLACATKEEKKAWDDLLKNMIKEAANASVAFEEFVLSDSQTALLDMERRYLRKVADRLDVTRFSQKTLGSVRPSDDGNNENANSTLNPDNIAIVCKILFYFEMIHRDISSRGDSLKRSANRFLQRIAESRFDGDQPFDELQELYQELDKLEQTTLQLMVGDGVGAAFSKIRDSIGELQRSIEKVMIARGAMQESHVDVDQIKLLDHLIDHMKEKHIELEEGTRSHISNVDNYLKRLSIALEDDFKVQFYDPAFAGVREAGRRETVNLGQIERTTILTNNRQFAKVSPQATMEFDLPKRAPVIVEAMNGAKALMQDYGALANDPTFLGLTSALSGSPAVGGAGNGSLPGVQPVFPTLGTDTQPTFLSGNSSAGGRQKTALEELIPDPAIYKFQTGTGFEIRPVIQPDGHSIIYNFKYLYTTNVREPVDPNEKHLGRIKQHFIDTEVQTSSFELREISRYQVALRASRTSRGVPLLEEIPVAGALFRPAASDESSLQQNIILGQTMVYPTLFDLMGLRWSRHVADLNHVSLRDQEHVVRGRNQSISDVVFDRSSEFVDRFLDIKRRNSANHRPDFYHRQRQPSPYHPGGYIHPDVQDDPTGRNYYRRDPRPEEMRHEPPFDEYRGGPANHSLEGRERISDPRFDPYHPGEKTLDTELEIIEQSKNNGPDTLFPLQNSERIAFPPPAPAAQSIRQMNYKQSPIDGTDKVTERPAVIPVERKPTEAVNPEPPEQSKPGWRDKVMNGLFRRK